MSNYSRRVFLRNSGMATAGLAIGKYAFSQPLADYTYLSIAEVGELVRQKKVSPVELTKACLKRIEKLNPKLNAFITITAELALKAAADAEAEIKNGKWKGPLHGVPIALKDNIDRAGIKTTAATAVYKDRVPTEDAEVVTLLKNAGAVIVGKLNMHEFGWGTTSVESYFGSVHNPWNLDYIAGGSSGGSAAAVAAGLCYAAMGTDTGGSSRLPPACCGIVGLMPTYDLISRRGVIPMVQSFDHVCPICRTVEDVAIMLNVLVTSSLKHEGSKIDYTQSFKKIEHPVIGVVQNAKASDEVKASFDDAVHTFQSLDYKTTHIDLPAPPHSGRAVFSNELLAIQQPLIKQYKELYDISTYNGITNFKETNSAEYINAKNEMDAIRNSISGLIFKDNDVLILPTTTTVPLTIAEAKANGPLALGIENTIPFDYYGLPAISVPCGFSKNSLPLGLQIVGPKWGEAKVLDIAYRYQKATAWHLKRPVIG